MAQCDADHKDHLRFLQRQVQDQLFLLNKQQCELDTRFQHLCMQETQLLEKQHQLDQLQKEAQNTQQEKEADLNVQCKAQAKAEKSIAKRLKKCEVLEQKLIKREETLLALQARIVEQYHSVVEAYAELQARLIATPCLIKESQRGIDSASVPSQMLVVTDHQHNTEVPDSSQVALVQSTMNCPTIKASSSAAGPVGCTADGLKRDHYYNPVLNPSSHVELIEVPTAVPTTAFISTALLEGTVAATKSLLGATDVMCNTAAVISSVASNMDISNSAPFPVMMDRDAGAVIINPCKSAPSQLLPTAESPSFSLAPEAVQSVSANVDTSLLLDAADSLLQQSLPHNKSDPVVILQQQQTTPHQSDPVVILQQQQATHHQSDPVVILQQQLQQQTTPHQQSDLEGLKLTPLQRTLLQQHTLCALTSSLMKDHNSTADMATMLKDTSLPFSSSCPAEALACHDVSSFHHPDHHSDQRGSKHDGHSSQLVAQRPSNSGITLITQQVDQQGPGPSDLGITQKVDEQGPGPSNSGISTQQVDQQVPGVISREWLPDFAQGLASAGSLCFMSSADKDLDPPVTDDRRGPAPGGLGHVADSTCHVADDRRGPAPGGGGLAGHHVADITGPAADGLNHVDADDREPAVTHEVTIEISSQKTTGTGKIMTSWSGHNAAGRLCKATNVHKEANMMPRINSAPGSNNNNAGRRNHDATYHRAAAVKAPPKTGVIMTHHDATSGVGSRSYISSGGYVAVYSGGGTSSSGAAPSGGSWSNSRDSLSLSKGLSNSRPSSIRLVVDPCHQDDGGCSNNIGAITPEAGSHHAPSTSATIGPTSLSKSAVNTTIVSSSIITPAMTLSSAVGNYCGRTSSLGKRPGRLEMMVRMRKKQAQEEVDEEDEISAELDKAIKLLRSEVQSVQDR
ncbi:hypothetical protein CEUSTIGMA_g7125.t1 [Chlamydomonas eustigma]|uniref:Uncharacterized protein n=1 Tax=Chlamydomonas eustigma TaxID=1157962 RepID=A0A250X9C8_9CHLO|nr:hypothetical protein CEUSTIGMA_g7125.t1 [Chlamydomonas eustigma]|eukprot:GAX79684.1 hypothetical protein CEUSTIGMA_g7125.t1 [Chlamydomonas eustigma]